MKKRIANLGPFNSGEKDKLNEELKEEIPDAEEHIKFVKANVKHLINDALRNIKSDDLNRDGLLLA